MLIVATKKAMAIEGNVLIRIYGSFEENHENSYNKERDTILVPKTEARKFECNVSTCY